MQERTLYGSEETREYLLLADARREDVMKRLVSEEEPG